ncbi:MAG: DNA polymerase III subunit gamma/tau [Lachnospiraceae bacterium]|nr:DNA polymerase III subunit gamma/tau [Lachnospiraceae bacterium]
MAYTALYRKFRPNEFEDVKGQEHIVKTLRNQVNAGRIGHAYLFCGTRGTGKTTIAKILAKAVNCEHPVEGSPCNTCSVCQSIQNQTSMNVIEIDAASNNGVDNIREIVEEVQYSPTEGKYKVYIIDEVHMLSTGAFNALLKTLEEPPSYVIFILATTEAHKIPITILSRCQRYDFRRITIDVIANRLQELLDKEQIEAEERAVQYVAKAGDGSMRDALSLLDRCIAFYLGEKLTYDKVLEVLGAVDVEIFSKLFRAIVTNSVKECMVILEELVVRGRELGQVITDFTWYLRNLLLVKTSENASNVVDVSTEHYQVMKEEAAMTDMEVIIRYIRIMSELSNQVRYATQKRVLIEVALIKLCCPVTEKDYEGLVNRIHVLEQKLENGVVMSPRQSIDDTVGMSNEAMEENIPLEVLERAIPDDLQEVAKNWERIIGMQDGLYKAMLMDVIPSVAEGGALLLAVKDPVQMDFLNKEEHIEEIKHAIEKQINKEIDIRVQYMPPDSTEAKSMVDLTKLTKMAIEFEP